MLPIWYSTWSIPTPLSAKPTRTYGRGLCGYAKEGEEHEWQSKVRADVCASYPWWDSSPSTDLHQPNMEHLGMDVSAVGETAATAGQGSPTPNPESHKSHENSHTTRWCFKKNPMNTSLHRLNRLPTLSWILPKCSMSRYLPTSASKRRREK